MSAITTDRIGDEERLKQLPAALRALADYERFHLHTVDLFQITARDPAFDIRYFPQNCGAFELPCFWVRRKHLYVCGGQSNDDELVLAQAGGTDPETRVLFPVHPLNLVRYSSFLAHAQASDARADGLRVWAVPTSSTRTLLVWPDAAPDKALFVKTSLHSPILGDRSIYRHKAARSVGLFRLIRESMAALPPALSYFPEETSFVPRCMPDAGVVVRRIPADLKAGTVVVAPLFALFGGSEAHQPLLLTILARSRMEPMEFVNDVLCAPFVELWLKMSMDFGLLLEAHGQDLMIALSPNLLPLRRFFYRDFEGLQVDWDLRRRRRLAMPLKLPNECAWRQTYATWGYEYSELAWYKARVSLFDYLFFVLHQLDTCLQQWQEWGLIGGQRIEPDAVTMAFSDHMIRAIEASFGVRLGPVYDIFRSLNKFVVSLMKIRRELYPLTAFTESSGEESGCGRHVRSLAGHVQLKRKK